MLRMTTTGTVKELIMVLVVTSWLNRSQNCHYRRKLMRFPLKTIPGWLAWTWTVSASSLSLLPLYLLGPTFKSKDIACWKIELLHIWPLLRWWPGKFFSKFWTNLVTNIVSLGLIVVEPFYPDFCYICGHTIIID